MMTHADYLSRNPPAVYVKHIKKPLNWAQVAQAADDETRELLQKLSEGQLDPRRYEYRNSLLYYRYTPVGEDPKLLCYIPKGHRLSLLRVFHDEHGHIVADKTLDLIRKHFWFPGLRQFVVKAPKQSFTSWTKPDIPFSHVHVSMCWVPLPESKDHKFVFVLVDSFTKFCLLYSMYRQDTNKLKRVIDNAISLFGVPKLIICDRRRMFEAFIFTSWISALGCEIHYITSEMHHSNGQAE
ncbi:unnamed protein product [Euphydryas editha]|uniref:RNA-directed DNA polymerase n=1 Tax=Euphydryas editha TaxID=104508 RepID=A0AAU9ULY1_EUPED|nr:unnamed protein product [Euphydryas editha]